MNIDVYEVERRTPQNLKYQVENFLSGRSYIERTTYGTDTYFSFDLTKGRIHRLRETLYEDGKKTFLEQIKVPANNHHFIEKPDNELTPEEYHNLITKNNVLLQVPVIRRQIETPEITFCLDKVLILGFPRDWTEFEILVEDELQISSAEKKIYEVVRSLGLSTNGLVKETYPEMALNMKNGKPYYH